MTFKVKDILNIVSKYSTANAIKKLNEVELAPGKKIGKYKGILDMYEQIGIPINPKALPRSINKFVELSEPIYNPKKVSEKDFEIYANKLNVILEGTLNIGNKGADNPNLEQLLKIKGLIKKLVIKYSGKDKDSPFDRIRFKSGLSQQSNIADKKKKAKDATDFKNKNQLVIPLEAMQTFYRSIFFKTNKTLLDNIIAFQASIGCRLIEVLSSKVSKFEAIDGNLIRQTGVAKMKGDVVEKRVIEKPTVNIIDAVDAMPFLEEVRKETKHFENLSNDKLTSKYNQNINNRIKIYLQNAGIPITKETLGSHSLRKLYANYTYASRPNNKYTKHQWIKEKLGHAGDTSTINYNAIEISSDPILAKDSAQIVNANLINTKENTKELTQMKEAIEEIKQGVNNPAPIEKKIAFNKTEKKFEELDKAIANGANTYKAIQALGFTTYIIAKYKRARNIKHFQKHIPKKNDK